MTKRTVSIGEASSILGLTRDAIRKRIKRNSIEAKKDKNGQWQISVEDTVQDTGEDNGEVASRTLVDVMQREIDFLRKELERKDHILMALTQKIPLLEAPKEDKPSEERVPFWRRWWKT